MTRILLGKGDQPVHLLAQYGNRRREGVVEVMARQILRGVLGGILRGGRRR